jgi:hypothetical protein
VSTQTIGVTVNGDATSESDETFVVNLSGATNASIGTGQGVGTIVNDEVAPGPALGVSATTVNTGGAITVTVSNGPGNPSDWVTLAAAGSADSSYLAWKYLSDSTIAPGTGLTSAALHFAAPVTPGTYEFRLFAGNTKLATSLTVTVQNPVLTLTVSPTTVHAGDTITVTVADGPAGLADWVALSPASAPDTTYVAWEYLSGSTMLPPTGLSSATLQFTAPATPGTYNFRFYANNTFTKLVTSATLTVQ